MSDEFNKGYFSTGPQHTYEAQQGQWARREDERRAREAAERAERERQERANEQWLRAASATWQPGAALPHTGSRAAHAPGSKAPPTLAACVKGWALLGMVLAGGYAWLVIGMPAGPALLGWVGQGALWGAVAGAVAYAALVILGVVFKALAVLLRFAAIAAMLVGALYLITQMG